MHISSEARLDSLRNIANIKLMRRDKDAED
jgi:hypothetical protein